jgi:hypothetical protein
MPEEGILAATSGLFVVEVPALYILGFLSAKSLNARVVVSRGVLFLCTRQHTYHAGERRADRGKKMMKEKGEGQGKRVCVCVCVCVFVGGFSGMSEILK